jgi:hypothetical protein
VLQSTCIEESIAATPDQVYAAARAIAASLWRVEEAHIVVCSPPSLLVHSVTVDDEISCWLTWEIGGSDNKARVRLVHDDADSRPAPEPELGAVMAVLRTQLSIPAPRDATPDAPDTATA